MPPSDRPGDDREGDGLAAVDDLLADLEQQADGLALSQRDAEVAELSRAEFAAVDFAARLHASVGQPVRVDVQGFGAVDGRLQRVGPDWFVVAAGPQEWMIRVAAALGVRGLASRGLAEGARPVTSRLTLASALRTLAEQRAEAVLHRIDGSRCRGLVERVGADFVDVRPGERDGERDGGADRGLRETVPFAALAAVRSC